MLGKCVREKHYFIYEKVVEEQIFLTFVLFFNKGIYRLFCFSVKRMTKTLKYKSPTPHGNILVLYEEGKGHVLLKEHF